jgi:Family of unknown function (DUF5367)
MLKTPKLVLFVVLGIVFWFAAAMLVRFAGASVFTGDNPLLIILYVASFPILFATIALARALSGFAMQDMFEPTVIMTLTALFLDGIAIAWFSQLYGETPTHVMRGAALIMWGAGAGLLCAWLLSKPKQIR